MQPYDAIVLVGGTGSRLGGVDKANVELAGAPVVAMVFAAVRDARRMIVVGETAAPIPAGAEVVREVPPGGGPTAGIVAGLAHLSATSVECPNGNGGQEGTNARWVVVLGCDLPGADRALPRVLVAASGDGASDGAIAVDDDGRPQWVLGVYATDALQRAARALGDPYGSPLRALLGGLDLTAVSVGDDWRDVDTWEDHAEWTDRLHRRKP